MHITVDYRENEQNLFVSTPYNTEVEAFNEYSGEFEYALIADCDVMPRSGQYYIKPEIAQLG